MKRKTCKRNCYETYNTHFLEGYFYVWEMEKKKKIKTLYFEKTDDTLGNFLKKIRKN